MNTKKEYPNTREIISPVDLLPFRTLTIISTILILIIAGCASTKKAVPSFIGNWAYTIIGTPVDAKGVFTIDQSNDGYKGIFRVLGTSTDMQDLKIEGNKTSCYIMFEGYKLDIKGEFAGNKFEGIVSTEYIDEYYEFKIEAVKTQ